jgi:hypothetical protein
VPGPKDVVTQWYHQDLWRLHHWYFHAGEALGTSGVLGGYYWLWRVEPGTVELMPSRLIFYTPCAELGEQGHPREGRLDRRECRPYHFHHGESR